MVFYKRALVKKARKIKAGSVRQELLKRKAGVEGQDVIVVEKSNTIKFLVATCGIVVRSAASILISALALTGLIALVYPAPRKELLDILAGTVEVLSSFF